MNKDAVNDSFLLFQDTGYNGTIEDFTKLISTNDEALADAYGLFTNTGYNGTQDDFNELVGVKKKDTTEVSELVSEGGPEGTTSVTEEVATTTPSGSLAGEETEVVEQTTVTETDKCPPGQAWSEKHGRCVNLSVLETTPIDQSKKFTIGESIEYPQNLETGAYEYPEGVEGPTCSIGFAWDGNKCVPREQLQEAFNALSPSQKDAFIKDKGIDDQTAKDLFEISFQEEDPKDLTKEEQKLNQEQKDLYEVPIPATEREVKAQEVRDRVAKSLKDELNISLSTNELFIDDINYDRPPTDMLTNELPTVGPSGEQVIYMGPSTIGGMIIGKDEEEVEIALSEIYGGWGFTFEQDDVLGLIKGGGDAIIVTSNAQEDLNSSTLKNMTPSEQLEYKLKKGISVKIDLQPYGGEEGQKKEINKLKNFIDLNYYRPELYDKDAPENLPRGYVDATLDDIYQAAKKGDTKQFRRIYNEDVIEKELATLKEADTKLSTEIPQFEQDVNSYNEKYDSYEIQSSDFKSRLNAFNNEVEIFTQSVEKGLIPYEEADKFYAEAEKREQQLLAEQDRLVVMEESLKEEGASLKERYGQINIAKNKITAYDPEKLQVIAAEQALYLAQQGTVTGALWESFLGAIDSRNTAVMNFGIDLAGYMEQYMFDEGQWRSRAKEGETKDEYFNRARREVKREIIPYIQNVYKDAFGTDVTNEYQAAFQETTFGAVTTSLSQLAAHGVMSFGNPTMMGASFGAQIYGDISTELMNEEYDDMTENEKLAVAGSISLVSGILEKYGLSKLFPGTGKISQTILTRALGRLKGKASYESLEQAIEMEVAALPKAFFRTGNAMLIEGGVEGTQAAAEIGIKQIYNLLKNKEVFEDGNIVSKQAVSTILNNAYIGAIAGGSIGTVTAGVNAYKDNAMNKLNKDQFNSVKLFATDAEFREIYYFQLKGEIQDGTLDPETAKKNWADLNKMVALFEQTDGINLNTEQQQEAFTLLNEKQKLKEQIAGKDESLTKPQRDRIKAIDTRLGRISERVSFIQETMDEALTPSYKIDGQEVFEQDFIDKLNDPAFKEKMKAGETNIEVKAPSPEVEAVYNPFLEEISEMEVTEAAPEVTEVVIDKPAITENTTIETNRIKELDAKAEDGQTFNLDGTTYNEGGLVVPVMSINTTQEEITPEKIAEFVEQNQESIGDAGVVKVGIYKFPNSNQVSIDLNIVVPSENREVALEFGRLAGQESLFDLSTFENVKTGSDGKNPVSFSAEQFRQIASSLKNNELPNVFEQTTEATTETEADAPQRKADKIIEGLEKLKKDLDQPGTLQVNLFPGQDKAVKAAIDITIGAIKAGDVVVQAIEKGYKKLKELGFEGSLEDYQNYLVQNPDVEITEADITVEEEVIDLKEATLEEQIKDLEGRDDAAARRQRNKLQEELDNYRAQKEAEAEATVEEEVTEEPIVGTEGLTQEEIAAKQKEEGIIVPVKDGNVASRLWNKTKSIKRFLFSAKRRLPKSVFKYKENKDASIAKSLNTVKNTAADFNKAYKNYEGDKEQLISDVNAYLEGNTDIVLPDEFKGVVNTMRNQIDYLSTELINTGALSPEQAATVESNLGSYLNRDYKVFTDKNWKKKVTEETVNKAKNFLAKQIQEQVTNNPDQYLQKGETVEQAVERLVNNKINEYLDREGAANNFFQGMEDKRNLSLFKEKSDIPVEIRALMGEFTDPVQRYAQSVSKLVNEVSTVKYFQNIKDAGMGVYFFEKGKAPDGFTYQIAPDATKSYDPLGGLYTTPEIGKDLEKATQNINKLAEYYFKVQSGVKWAKTIGSVGTHSKNIIGNVGFMLVNGHNPLDVKTMGEAYTSIRSNLFPKSDKTRLWKGKMSDQDKQEIRDRYNRYVELGIINQSAGLGEIRDMFRDANFDVAMKERLDKKPKSFYDQTIGRGVSGLKRVKEGAEAAYQAEDDFFKIVAFETELNRYSKAMFGKNKADLSEQEAAEVEDHVAEIVKNTYPNYARVPEAVKKLRRNPLIGNFVSFQAEVYRTTYNSVALAFKEIKSDNPKIKKIGATRLASMLSYTAAKNGMIGYFGMAAATGLSGDAEDDDQLNKDMRRFVPFFSTNSDLLPLNVSSGVVEYLDISSSDPHGGLNKIVNAFMSGENTVEAFGNAFSEALSPFTGIDITTATANELFNNEDTYGRQIYNPQDPDILSQITDVSDYIIRKVELGSMSSVRKILNAKEGETMETILGQLTGFKPWKFEPAEQISFKARDAKAEIKDAKSIYNKENYRFDKGEATQADKDEAYDKSVRALKDIYERLIEDYNAAIRLGADPQKVQESLETSGLSRDEIAGIVNGEVPEYIPYDVKKKQQEEKREQALQAEAEKKDIDPSKLKGKDDELKPEVEELLKEYKYHKDKHKMLNEGEVKDILLEAKKNDVDVSIILDREFAIKKIMIEQNIGKEQAKEQWQESQ